MALRTLVKISSVNNLSVARYCAGMGVNLMGFNLDESSEDYVTIEAFEAITGWISGIKIVGEIQSANVDLIFKSIKDYRLDYLQFTDVTLINEIGRLPLPFIIKINQPDQHYIKKILEQFGSSAAWFLVEMPAPVSKELLEWLSHQAASYSIILGNNVSADNINDLIDLGFSGFAFAGGNEIKPGYKDFDELADVLEALEVND